MDIREKLLDAALRVFQESGSRGATTRRIAREAGVNEVTLFRHFGSKGSLISAALQVAAAQNLVAGLPEEPSDPERELAEWCRAHLDHLVRSRAMIRSCMGDLDQAPEMACCAAAIPRRVAGELQAYLLRLRERGLAGDGFDPHVAAGMLMGALFTDAMGRDVMPDRFEFSLDEAPTRYVGFILRAVGATPRPAPRLRPAPRAVAGT